MRFKDISRMNLNSKAFIHEIIYQYITKDGAYVVHLDEFKLIGIHWRTLYLNSNSVTYFDSFGVERVTKEIKNLLAIKIS